MRTVVFCLVLFGGMVSPVASADTAWVRTYNGADNGADEAVAVATDDSGNVYVCGWSNSAATGEDWVTIKYRLDGSVAWSRIYSGSGIHSDRPAALAVDAAGNVYVTGRSFLGTSNDFYTIKYSSTGTELWAHEYHGVANTDDYATAIALTPGGIAVTGASTGSAVGYDYAVVVYTAAGAVDWVRRYDGTQPGAAPSDDLPAAVTVDASGSIIVTGESEDSLGVNDYLTVKFTSIGNIAWSRRYDGPASGIDHAVDVAVDSSGNVVVTGSSAGVGSASDYLTIKYTSAGGTAWTRRYAGPGNCSQGTCEDNATALAIGQGGTVFVTGFSHQALTIAGDDFDIATVAYSSAGTQLWLRNYNGTGNMNDWGQDIAVGRHGNVFVAGITHGSLPYVDAIVLGYRATGDSLMAESYDGTDHLDDRAAAIMVDDSGNVVITGTTERNASSQDFLTIKYVTAALTGCCQGFTGNIDGKGIVDLSDLTALVGYLIIPGSALLCPEAANVNGRGIIDLSDLTLLVGYLINADQLATCP